MKTHIPDYFLGFDIGSTTAKLALIDSENKLIFSKYERHNTKINETTILLFQELSKFIGEKSFQLCITGSAGIGISERLGIPFVQEVIASTEAVNAFYPNAKTLIDIGGEDSKMIFFKENRPPDIRMNGSCAGGTGAFIDQMASLLGVSMVELSDLAMNSTQVFPIASRCGVFAKTDVQNLIARKIPKEDIAASIFHAIAIQMLNTVARGYDIVPRVLFCGGPFTFLPSLLTVFMKDLRLNEQDLILPEYPALLPAIGSALESRSIGKNYTAHSIINALVESGKAIDSGHHRLNPLFDSAEHFTSWNNQRFTNLIHEVLLADYLDEGIFLGVDSGSTTTKIVVTGMNQELLFKYYANNQGSPIETLAKGLMEFDQLCKKNNKKLHVLRSVATGYGEDLIKVSFGIDNGVVETIAHFSAARFLDKDVSFVLDIGGQDMKAIFVENGNVTSIELNESCSSGCGSFIETFGKTLGYSKEDFSQIACNSIAPCDLGTRCTVFMNSKVKQALRENATTGDIAAGLSMSVINNALFKVLKLKNIDVLGDHIVVQGGTFKNPSVHRALEKISGKKVICTNIPELMGAYGAALIAQNEFEETAICSKFIGFEDCLNKINFSSKQQLCKGCENQCTISRFVFDNGSVFFSGNKCEKYFTNKGNIVQKGSNLYPFKNKLLFERNPIESKAKKIPLRIGIPRALNFYENYPFWHALLTASGIEVVLSSPSVVKLYEQGAGTVMSDSICFPAKLYHGHIFDLAEKKVDRIFIPMVFYETKDHEKSDNSYNCPIVSSYGSVIESAINPQEKFNIPLDIPTVHFDDVRLLEKACWDYLKQFKIKKRDFSFAFKKAMEEQRNFKLKLKEEAARIIEKSVQNKELLVVLAGRPYHTDPLINHKTPEILEDLGANVITEDSVPTLEDGLTSLQIISQWTYPNRIYNAALWSANQSNRTQFVQFNSFGCGPDAIVIDECVEILKAKGKNHTLIRIDEISSTGSVRLRLRSMIESVKLIGFDHESIENPRQTTKVFDMVDKKRTLLAPQLSSIYSSLIPAIFELAGYRVENLPVPDRLSVQLGLQFTNNEICYPATIVVGDIIKALKSSHYNTDEIAVAITQTGGQCRASTYLSLIRKAMVDAGFKDVPVVAIGTEGISINPQPGFDIEWKKILGIVFAAVLFADSVSKMYYSLVSKEKNKGESKKLLDSLLLMAQDAIRKNNSSLIFELLGVAVDKFNQIEIIEKFYPKIGVVGEIYVKYNSFGHKFVIDWLIEQGIEVIVPPIVDFFIQPFVNIEVNRKLNLRRSSFSDIFLYFLEYKANSIIKKTNKILSKFRYHIPFHKLRDMSAKAEKILSLANQFGEGWLIPAEISTMAEEEVNNVISLQPFGCIANHVISKGVEKRMKDKYPDLNLLFLDFDDGTSEVNLINRLHFLMRNIKEKPEIKLQVKSQ